MIRHRFICLFAVLLSGGALPSLAGDTKSSANAGSKAPTYDQVMKWIAAYKKAHAGHGGRDWDINSKSAAEIAREPDTKRLLSICGPDQRPVIPALAWEYGGSDHAWENPEASALVYCVYTPVKKGSEHWQYDAAKNRVIADVYVKFPDQNPCKDEEGAGQVTECVDDGNIEILVDTASLNDGKRVGLNLSEASTELRLILPNGKKVRIGVMN